MERVTCGLVLDADVAEIDAVTEAGAEPVAGPQASVLESLGFCNVLSVDSVSGSLVDVGIMLLVDEENVVGGSLVLEGVEEVVDVSLVLEGVELELELEVELELVGVGVEEVDVEVVDVEVGVGVGVVELDVEDVVGLALEEEEDDEEEVEEEDEVEDEDVGVGVVLVVEVEEEVVTNVEVDVGSGVLSTGSARYGSTAAKLASVTRLIWPPMRGAGALSARRPWMASRAHIWGPRPVLPSKLYSYHRMPHCVPLSPPEQAAPAASAEGMSQEATLLWREGIMRVLCHMKRARKPLKVLISALPTKQVSVSSQAPSYMTLLSMKNQSAPSSSLVARSAH